MIEGNDQELDRCAVLPTPYERVSEQILLELIIDPPRFAEKYERKFREENSDLAQFILERCERLAPDKKWAKEIVLFYYEIFSRSAEREGKLMMHVPNQTIKTEITLKETSMQLAQARGPQAVARLFERLGKEAEVLTQSEISGNPELAHFWSEVNTHIAVQTSVGRNPDDLFASRTGVYQLRTLLQAQEEANKKS